jgi:PAS domain S-box-containing protein
MVGRAAGTLKGTIAMVHEQSPRATVDSLAFPVVVGLLAIGIFTVDVLSRLPDAVAVLYVVVVLLSVNFLQWRGVLLVSLGCAALAVLGYLLQHGLSLAGDPLARLLVSLSAIGATTFLALKNKAGAGALQERSRLLDLAHDTIFVRDMNDVITYWNQGAVERYGWQSDEAIGKVSHQLMQTIFPAPLEEINAALLRTGRWEGELVHARRQGGPLIVASRWSLQRDERGRPVAILETNSDITDRKRVEDALRRSEAYLSEAQRLSHTGSWAFDVASRRVIHSSEEHHRLIGIDPGADIPAWEEWERRIHPEDRERAMGGIEQGIRERTDFEMEYGIVHPDGTIKYVQTVGHPVFGPSGELVEFVGTLVDVTERKQADEALHKTQMELAHVARVATLGELAASIAHEVNQPLAAIVTNGEVGLRWLDREVPDLAEVREALGDMIRNGRRASEIIQRLRALSRKSETQKVAVDINDAISEVIPLVQQEVLSHRVSLRLELAPTLPAVLGDRVQLQQVIINLIVNGMEAMAPVTDRRRELVVRSQLDDSGEVLVAVEDAGVGIDPENAKQLFNAFFTTKPSGMGMGLSICRSIIDAHGGRLWAEANEPRGAVFQFTLRSHQEARP